MELSWLGFVAGENLKTQRKSKLCIFILSQTKPKSNKMPSLFSDEEEDAGGMFGGTGDDIFEAASPPKVRTSYQPTVCLYQISAQ